MVARGQKICHCVTRCGIPLPVISQLVPRALTLPTMFSELDVDIRPGSGLGIFELGSFSSILRFQLANAQNTTQVHLCGRSLNS